MSLWTKVISVVTGIAAILGLLAWGWGPAKAYVHYTEVHVHEWIEFSNNVNYEHCVDKCFKTCHRTCELNDTVLANCKCDCGQPGSDCDRLYGGHGQ